MFHCSHKSHAHECKSDDMNLSEFTHCLREISGHIHIMKFSTGKYLFNRMHESQPSETQQIMKERKKNLGMSFLHSALLHTDWMRAEISLMEGRKQ